MASAVHASETQSVQCTHAEKVDATLKFLLLPCCLSEAPLQQNSLSTTHGTADRWIRAKLANGLWTLEKAFACQRKHACRAKGFYKWSDLQAGRRAPETFGTVQSIPGAQAIKRWPEFQANSRRQSHPERFAKFLHAHTLRTPPMVSGYAKTWHRRWLAIWCFTFLCTTVRQ
jgi:hypothetical protein